MSKSDMLESTGIITSAKGNGCFTVLLDINDTEIPCQLAGKLRKNSIKVLVGDTVKVAMSPYDVTHGLITFRIK